MHIPLDYKINSKDRKKSIDDIEHLVKNVTGRTPAELTRNSYQALTNTNFNGEKIKRNNTKIGEYFELSLYNCLLTFGIARERIEMYVEDKQTAAEIDFVIKPSSKNKIEFHLHLKSSLRERWQIADRSALIDHMARGNTKCKRILIFVMEHKDDDLRKIHHWIEKHQPQFRGLQGAISILDDEAFNKLIDEIGEN